MPFEKLKKPMTVWKKCVIEVGTTRRDLYWRTSDPQRVWRKVYKTVIVKLCVNAGALVRFEESPYEKGSGKRGSPHRPKLTYTPKPSLDKRVEVRAPRGKMRVSSAFVERIEDCNGRKIADDIVAVPYHLTSVDIHGVPEVKMLRYRVGERVVPDEFSHIDDTCAAGIHVFRTKKEAIEHGR